MIAKTRSSPGRKIARAFVLIVETLAYSATFVLALAIAVVLHLDSPSARAITTQAANRVLALPLQGKIVVTGADHIGAHGIRGVDAYVTAPDGARVVTARGISARIDPLALVRTLVARRGDIGIGVFDIEITDADVSLDGDGKGSLEIAEAFRPRQTPSDPNAPPGRRAIVDLPKILVRHAWVHGAIPGAPLIDADVTDLHAELYVREDVTIVGHGLHVVTRGAPRGANLNGDAQARMTIPTKGGAIAWSGAWAGDVGGVPVKAASASDGLVAHASLDVDPLDPELLRTMLPEVPLHQRVALHAEAQGTIRDLEVTARAALGNGEVTADARIAGDEDALAIAGRVNAQNIDVRAFDLRAPASSLGAIAGFDLATRADGVLHGTFDVATDAGRIAAREVPPVTLRGSVDRVTTQGGHAGGIALSARGRIAEPGAPTEITINMDPKAGPHAIRFTTHTTVARLADVTRVSGLGPGRANVNAAGALLLENTPTFEASVEVAADGVAYAGVGAATIAAIVHAKGTFAEPALESTFDADGLSIGGRTFGRVSGSTTGTLRAEDFTLVATGGDAPKLTAKGRLDLGQALKVTEGELTAERGNVKLHADVPLVNIKGGEVDVMAAQITGVGDPLEASISLRHNELGIKVNTKGLDLQAIGVLFGIEDRLRSGRAALAVDAHGWRDSVEGTARVELSHVTFDKMNDAAAQLDATMTGRTVTGSFHAELPGVASVDASKVMIEVGGAGPLAGESWKRAFGHIRLDGRGDLARIAAILPPDALPLSDLRGAVTFVAYGSRASETDKTPNVHVSVTSHGLYLAGGAPPSALRGTTIVARPTWQLDGVDVTADVDANGSSGFAEAFAQMTDAHGALVTVNAKSVVLPYDALFDGGAVAKMRLLRTPMSLRVRVPAREIAELPTAVRPGASGVARADIAFDGTLIAPTVAVDASVHALRVAGATDRHGLDVGIHAQLAGQAADATLNVGSLTESYLHATGHATTDIAAWLRGDTSGAWRTDARATLTHFPIGTIADLADRDVRGRVSGEIAVTDYHADARAKAALDFDNLRIGRGRFKRANLIASYDGRALAAHASVAQSDGGGAEVNLKSALAWGASLAPAPDPNGATRADLSAKRLQASFLEPFLSSALDELDGLIDADAHLALAPGAKPQMSGSVLFHDGRLEISAIGEELHGVNAKVTLSPTGDLKLDDAVALGTTGRATATGVAHVDGVHLVNASTSLVIDKNQALPMALGGSNLGLVYGKVDLSARTSDDRSATTVDITVPDLHIALPQATPHVVQGLDPQPANVHVGVRAPAHGFVVLVPTGDAPSSAPDAKATSLTVLLHLGNIEVKRGTELSAVIGGNPTVRVAGKTTMNGTIVLKSGKLAVQGKPFDIQKGTATFVGDPANPEVNVTASWKAQDGTEVFAELIGPLKTSKVVLRSDPPRPRNEIVSLILFGTADGAQATPYAQPQPSTTTRAGTAVGGIAAGDLNRGLDKITGLDIAAKIDTSQSNPRPEVEVEIARDLSVELAFVLGTPPPGTNQDTTYATVDWRFVRNWSLATTFGNLGSTIADVVWRRRY